MIRAAAGRTFGRRAFAVAALLVLCGAATPDERASRRHPPPTVYLEVDVLPAAVAIDVVGELQVWNTWLGLDVSGEFLLSDADVERIKVGASKLFATKNKVTIDQRVVAPVVAEVVPPSDFIPGRNIPNVRVRLRLALEREPNTVGIVWETFEATDLFEKQAVPAMVRYRGDVEQGVMTPHEPEYVWHTRVVQRRAPRVDAITSAPPRARELPLPSTLLALGAVVALLAGRRRGHSVPARVAVLAALVASAVALRHVGMVRLPGTGFGIPQGEAALAIFQRLHGNIYRAFDAHTPEEVYDLLAVSVAPHLLDQTYADVFESLVLRGQGGAVCKIEKVDLFEREFEKDPEGLAAALPRYFVRCAWRVHGVVSHWGHEHRRLNQYRARYAVAHDGRAWRIEHVEVQEQQRLDDNG